MTVDVLEGQRRSAQADVVGVVDDLLGVSAYASLAELQRFAGGVAVISGAALQVDKRRLDSLYLAVKQLPVITGVSVREAMRNSFEATIGESFAISLTVMLVFAAVIAFGIIYNNARVALSERGRELASLRILGFTHREVATMLLGEQGVLLALALPLGVAAAWGLMWAVTQRFESTLFRIPIVISGTSMVLGSLGVLAAAGVTARLVVRRLRKLDLVEVLKTRE
jgi:putative ABC transport system permease protein